MNRIIFDLWIWSMISIYWIYFKILFDALLNILIILWIMLDWFQFQMVLCIDWNIKLVLWKKKFELRWILIRSLIIYRNLASRSYTPVYRYSTNKGYMLVYQYFVSESYQYRLYVSISIPCQWTCMLVHWYLAMWFILCYINILLVGIVH